MLTTPIPTLTLDIISKFISEKIPFYTRDSIKIIYIHINVYNYITMIVTLYIKHTL
jgi:hypothetical protein